MAEVYGTGSVAEVRCRQSLRPEQLYAIGHHRSEALVLCLISDTAGFEVIRARFSTRRVGCLQLFGCFLKLYLQTVFIFENGRHVCQKSGVYDRDWTDTRRVGADPKAFEQGQRQPQD